MSDLLKILGAIAVLFGAFKAFTGTGDAAAVSRTERSAQPTTAASCGTPASVAQAKVNLQVAQQQLLAAQKSTAGTGTNYQTVKYGNGMKCTTTYTYCNAGVNARSEYIQNAQKRVQAAQLALAEAQRNELKSR